MATDDQRSAAIDRLKAKRDFQANLISFVVINAMLVVIWAVAGGGFFWPVFVIAGWGVGLILHGWTVYGRKPITEDEIKREMGKGGGTVE